jgi:hypothetical protein
MKSYFLIIIVFFCITNSSLSQLSVNHVSATDAAIYLVGPGVTISNATFSGNPLQLATFSSGNSYLGFNDGVILATGNAEFATTSNTSPSGSMRVDGPYITSDPDLSQLQNSLTGVAVLEFDLKTTGTSLEFEFVFCSEEYEEYVYDRFNDVFGFFISGPGIVGTFSNSGKNIALVPNTNDFISVHTINQDTHNDYYIHNYNSGNGTFTYDGYTKTITAYCDVQCNQTYHLRIAISNVADIIVDSGVLLKKGSVKSNFIIGDLIVAPQPACEGDNLNISVQGDPNWIYTWSTGQTGQNISTTANLNNTTYSVTVTNPVTSCVVSKEISVVVHPTNNIPPYLNGINNSGNYIYYIQYGQSSCFDIPSFDNPLEMVYVSWNNAIAGATFYTLPGDDIPRHYKGRFCWSPTRNDLGEHTFIVKVTDNNVCNSKSNQYTFTVNVVCCPLGIYYENRHPDNNPLPNITKRAQFIIAGYDVDNNQINGTVETGNASVLFKAGEQISLENGFVGGPNFSAQIVPVCINDCNDCCDNWNGFSISVIPNNFSPDGDGQNDYWEIVDYQNPFCAYNAKGFELEIFNRWGNSIYSKTNYNDFCCPFVSKGYPTDPTLSSINWDGKNKKGKLVNNGTYYYVLTLIGCNTNQTYEGSIELMTK